MICTVNTCQRCWNTNEKDIPLELRKQDTQIDLEKMKKSGYMLQNFAVFVDMSATDNPLEEALRTIALYYEQMEKNADIASPVPAASEITKNNSAGKMSALLTLRRAESVRENRISCLLCISSACG